MCYSCEVQLRHTGSAVSPCPCAARVAAMERNAATVICAAWFGRWCCGHTLLQHGKRGDSPDIDGGFHPKIILGLQMVEFLLP